MTDINADQVATELDNGRLPSLNMTKYVLVELYSKGGENREYMSK